MADRETGSYWNHITGECVLGPLKGYQLESFPLRYTTVSEELSKNPGCQVIFKRLNWFLNLFLPLAEKAHHRGMLPPHFRYSMRGKKDLRRPLTEMGLGVWTARTARFYPMAKLSASGGAAIDLIDGRSAVIAVGPTTGIPVAFWTAATEARWDGQTLRLNTGETVRDGDLYDAKGRLAENARPHQMFTRWYGFAYTFPDCEIFAGKGVAPRAG